MFLVCLCDCLRFFMDISNYYYDDLTFNLYFVALQGSIIIGFYWDLGIHTFCDKSLYKFLFLTNEI